MVFRLVLGCGSVGRDIVTSISGTGDLLVLTDEESRVNSLREEGVTAEVADPTNADAIRARAGHVDSIIVGSPQAARNREITTAAREAYPDAFLLAYTGLGATPGDREALAALADRTVDLGAAVAEALLQRVGDAGYRLRRLNRVLNAIDGRLAVVMHDNPDPDAIASAVALRMLAERAGIEADACYYGDINHQENRALVNLLAFDLVELDPAADPRETYGGFALVDHSRPGVNDQLPADTPVDIVIDHHPPRGPVEASFVDLRSDVGATSTLLTGYLEGFTVEPTAAVATGLLFGIRVDTMDFSREVSIEDFRAAATLVPHADADTLDRIESPSVSVETLECIGRAIRKREVHGEVVVSCIGRTGDRDALAQAADTLLDLEGVSVTFVYGYTDDMVYASARARGTDLDLGEALRDAFGQIGSAGGHADMAGAQLPVGALAVRFGEDEAEGVDHDPEDDLREAIDARFLEAIDITPDLAATTVYGQGNYMGADSPRLGTGLAGDTREDRAGDGESPPDHGSDPDDDAGARMDGEGHGGEGDA
ncbi:DHH family phosphoesterase [Haloglomus halophilum]|uniref:DHH family phosphoesterase n=1 Tax=Haloglomus halophilum TaxID=2962672 RepID=UPI0020C941A4|nr:DHH family phosphoesterase [Haloglomus halophilum]